MSNRDARNERPRSLSSTSTSFRLKHEKAGGSNMAFKFENTPEGLKKLDAYLAERSYIVGYRPSKADGSVFSALSSPPNAALHHALRWYNNIASYPPAERTKFGGSPCQIVESKTTAAAAAAPADDDDDVDLFGSDEEEDAAKDALREKRLQEYAAKKSGKPTLIAKSSIVLDVKPWDDETDMAEMEKVVRTIQMDGLIWGASKLVPVGYGINKLQIMCVVEDDKVSIDLLSETIQEFEDYVQSVDIAAFNKI